MRAVRICVCPLALVILLLSAAQSAFSAQVWTEQKIASGGTGGRYDPQIWGDEVYYTDGSSGRGQVYVWDQAGGERLFLGGSDSISVLAVYGNSLVVDHYVNHKDSLYLYDPVNGERLISATAGDSGHTPSAAIYGNTVAYEDIRSGVPQIYTWDPVNGERQIAPTNYDQTNPRIWGDTVVWEDYRNGSDAYHTKVYMWNPTDGAQSMGYLNSPGIYKDELYALRPYNPQFPNNAGGIYKWTAATGYQFVYSEKNSYWTDCYDPQAWGDLYVWGGGAWDPVNGVTHYAQATGGYYSGFSLYGHQVAWSNGQDIFIDTFAPEPSGLCALLLGLAGMCGSILRSRRRRNSP